MPRNSRLHHICNKLLQILARYVYFNKMTSCSTDEVSTDIYDILYDKYI